MWLKYEGSGIFFSSFACIKKSDEGRFLQSFNVIAARIDELFVLEKIVYVLNNSR